MGLWMTASLRHKVATDADLLASVAGMLQLYARVCPCPCARERKRAKSVAYAQAAPFKRQSKTKRKMETRMQQ